MNQTSEARQLARICALKGNPKVNPITAYSAKLIASPYRERPWQRLSISPSEE
jgi:hypothetical protein